MTSCADDCSDASANGIQGSQTRDHLQERAGGDGWRVPLTAEREVTDPTAEGSAIPDSRQASPGAQLLTTHLPPTHLPPNHLPPCPGPERSTISVEKPVLRRIQALIKESQTKLLSEVESQAKLLSEVLDLVDSTVPFSLDLTVNPVNWLDSPRKSNFTRGTTPTNGGGCRHDFVHESRFDGTRSIASLRSVNLDADVGEQSMSSLRRRQSAPSAHIKGSRFRDLLGGKTFCFAAVDESQEVPAAPSTPTPLVASDIKTSVVSGADGPVTGTTSGTHLRTFEHKETGLAGIVNGATFELVFAILIALNAFCMCLEAQYEGFQTAYLINYGDRPRPAEVVWPYAASVFEVLEFSFGMAFAVEVGLKVCALRKRFIYSAWNWFDSFIIGLFLVNTLSLFNVGLNPTFLRVARLGRLMRLLRFVKAFQVFDVLWLLVESVNACASVLLWSLVLLFLCMLMCTLFTNYLLAPVMVDPGYTPEEAFKLYEYFGTFSRGLLSMYELTMGNYVPIARTLHELVSEWFLPIILAYRCLVSFALMKVISGIFLHETFKTAASNDEIMIMQRDRMTRRHIAKMTQLFKEADESGDGELSLEEFRAVMSDPRVKTWLAAQELEVQDVELLFELVDNGSGTITAEELVAGFAQLKGPARSIDMLTLLRSLDTLSQDVAKLTKAAA
eukprot:TRINITY_DN15528_c0_g2_i1.p1 TRINITY_DN15528_c0_g2~~TRINITY_DN15528_c0_g2_i1.p1  ORF type:complete len:673 (+),score=97.29 TRINITY_DN15528_c0_g2_i1:58-2076(+)